MWRSVLILLRSLVLILVTASLALGQDAVVTSSRCGPRRPTAPARRLGRAVHLAA